MTPEQKKRIEQTYQPAIDRAYEAFNRADHEVKDAQSAIAGLTDEIDRLKRDLAAVERGYQEKVNRAAILEQEWINAESALDKALGYLTPVQA